MHKSLEYDRVEDVRRLYLRTDLEMCEEGIYHSYFDFEKGKSKLVVAVLANGARRQWEATLGEVKAFNSRTLEVHLSPEPEKNDMIVHKDVIVASLYEMMDSTVLHADREKASAAIDVALPLFRALAKELA
ncbi:hypothetical protein EYR38_003045 [Pleurotus pulmonarius]|nr:hypothetical protein EYR38_003045 [Pleurotus pulmonarius]